MQLGSPFDALHNAMAQAICKDLPPIRYWHRDWGAYNKLPKEEKTKLKASEGPGEWRERRPEYYEVTITMFAQTWGSTAIGYGGIGGAAMTPAYTVIVEEGACMCVYFGSGGLAYKVSAENSAEGRARFMKDIASQDMAHVRESGRYK